MATVKMIYKLTENGQRASLLAGGNGKPMQVVEIPATPETLAIARIKSDGSAWIIAAAAATIPGDKYEDKGACAYYLVTSDGKVADGTSYGRDFLSAPPADPMAHALAIPAENARRKAEAEAQAAEVLATIAKEQEGKLATSKVMLAEWLQDPKRGASTSYFSTSGKIALYSGEESGTVTDVVLDASDTAILLAELDRRKSALADQRAKIAAAKDVAETAAIADRDAWIAAHGSPRLKKGLATGMIDKMGTVYLDERIAHDLGDDWSSWQAAPEPKVNARLNPEETELDALAEARAKWPASDVRLRSVGGNQVDEHDEDHQWRPALLLNCPWDHTDEAIKYLD